MQTKFLQFAAAAVLTTAAATAAHAGFVGRTLSAGYYDHDQVTLYPLATTTPPVFTVGSGPETLINVEGVTKIAVDFTDNTLRFDFTTTLGSPTWRSEPFNGVIFDRLGGAAFSLTSASIDSSSTLGGFDASRVNFSDDRLTVDWNGLSYVNGNSLLIRFTSAPASVPEPGSLALLAIALVASASVCIARQKHAKAVGRPPL